MKPPHLLAQSVLVRMLYDGGFADAVRRAPREMLPELPGELADELGKIDPRALRRDRHRVERTLGTLCEELPLATMLAVAETGRMATLLSFFASRNAHESFRDGTSLVLALAAFLQQALAEGRLRSPHLAAVLAVELALAQARRSGDDPEGFERPQLHDRTKYRRARGVEVVRVPRGTLAALQAVREHRFRLGLLPAWSLASDPPALPALPPLGADTVWLAAISVRGNASLVEIEPAIGAVLSSLPAGEQRLREPVVSEATLRHAGDRAAVEAALDSLVADELVLTA